MFLSKKSFFFSFLVSLFFVSSSVLAIVAKVEIPCSQKNIVLTSSATYQFSANAYDENGNLYPQARFFWRILGLDGVETTIPGNIDETGLLRVAYFYSGTFRIVVTETTSGLSDSAHVDVKGGNPNPNPNGQIARIEIFPAYIGLRAGQTTQFSIFCYDAYGQRIFKYNLEYWVVDSYGFSAYNVLWIESPGILYTSPYTPRGPYTVYFRDSLGHALAQLRVDIF